MQLDFEKTMKEASNAELLKIITTDRDNYQEAAIEAAEVELSKRNLTPEEMKAAKKFNEEQQQIITFKSNLPLDTHWKVLTFIFPGILQIILSGTFKGDGYDRKADDLLKWTLYGFGFYIGLVIIISML